MTDERLARTFAIPRHDAPELCKQSARKKTEGAGNAGCPMHPQPRVQSVESTRVSHHRFTGVARRSLRNGFTAYSALSPATNSSCHRHRRIWLVQARSGSKNLRRFDTSNGCQDHTALPYAATSFVQRAVDRSRKTALRPRLRADAAASTASRPNVRDDHDTPLLRAGITRICRGDLPDGESGIFS